MIGSNLRKGCDMREITKQAAIENCIFLIRGQKVMLSTHLAGIYGVEAKRLIEAVKRNKERFPVDFMFPLTREEFTNLKSQIAASSWGGIRRATPYAFTEHGILMLSSVLNSRQAILANIAIMRTFVKLRQALAAHKELAHKLEALERKVGEHDAEIKSIFKAIRELMAPPPEKPKREIGFHARY